MKEKESLDLLKKIPQTIGGARTPLVIIFFLAICLRTMGLLSRPIWYDEAFSILLAEQGPSAIINGTLASDADTSAAEEHPPAYYFTLWGWMQIFGRSLISARMFSILLSIGIVFLIYLIARRLFDDQTAAASAFLAAILPFQIHYAQEMRMYALLSMWLLLATYSFLRARNGNWKWWIGFSVASALAQYTHNLAAFYLIPLALTPIFQKDWKTLRSLIPAGLVSIVIYLPWLIQLPAQVSKVNSFYWVTQPGLEKIFTLLLFYLPHLPLPDNLLFPALLIATLIIALAAFQTFLAGKNKISSASPGNWTAYLAFTPPAMLWLVSQSMPIYLERALLPSHAMFCIWLAWAFTQTRLPRPIQVLVFTLILAVAGAGAYQHVAYTGFPYTTPSLTRSIESRLEEGDVVIHSSKLSYLPSLYYSPALPQGFILDPANSSVDTLAPATRQVLNLTPFESIQNASANARRIWFIIYKHSLDEYTEAGKTHPHLEYLNEHFTQEFVEEWNDIRVYLYRKGS